VTRPLLRTAGFHHFFCAKMALDSGGEEGPLCAGKAAGAIHRPQIKERG